MNAVFYDYHATVRVNMLEKAFGSNNDGGNVGWKKKSFYCAYKVRVLSHHCFFWIDTGYSWQDKWNHGLIHTLPSYSVLEVDTKTFTIK